MIDTHLLIVTKEYLKPISALDYEKNDRNIIIMKRSELAVITGIYMALFTIVVLLSSRNKEETNGKSLIIKDL